MASAGEMDTNATAENLGHNAPNQDANIAPAVGTYRNNESTHLERTTTEQETIEETTLGDNASVATTRKHMTTASDVEDLATRKLPKPRWRKAQRAKRMALEASRAAVLNTPELLENIIASMPRAQILTGAMGVSQRWKNTIETSPTIKTLLWRGSLVLSPRRNTHDPTLTEEHERVFSCRSNFQVATKQAFGVPMYSGRIELNEHLFTGGPPRKDMFASGKPSGLFPEPHPRHQVDPSFPLEWHKEGVMSWVYTLKYRPGLGQVRPSFLDMFITSPPITTAQVSVYMWSSIMAVFPLWVCASVYDRRGITYAIAAEAIRKIRSCIPPRDHRAAGYIPPMICFVADGKEFSVDVSEE